MAVIKYMSIDLVTREATFDVDGESVTRQIADDINDSNLDVHLQALADGLCIEYTKKEVVAITKEPLIAAETVLAGE